MKEYDLNALLNDASLVDARLREFALKKVLKKQKPEKNEIRGHVLKAENNLRFVKENINLGFLDWAITGCYYACYHAALALIMTKGYSSKNHLATLCLLIREFYRHGLNESDFESLSNFIDYQDLLFYVEAKNKREDAAYTSRLQFNHSDVEKLRLQAITLVSKFKSVLKSSA